MFKIGLGVTFVKEIPVSSGDFSTFKCLKKNARFFDLATLLFDFFSFFLIERLKKLFKVCKRFVVPVKLNRMAAEPSRSFGGFQI